MLYRTVGRRPSRCYRDRCPLPQSRTAVRRRYRTAAQRHYQCRCPPPLLRTAICRHYRSCCPPPLSRTAVCRCYDRPLSAAAIAQTNHPVNTNLALCVMLLLQTASRRYSLTTGRCRSRGLLAAVALANRWTPLLSRTACRLVHPPPATAAQVACRISVP